MDEWHQPAIENSPKVDFFFPLCKSECADLLSNWQINNNGCQGLD